MSAILTIESEDLYVIRLKGTLAFEDLTEMQGKVRAEFDHSRRIKLLILAERFSGWGREGDWGDLTFMYEFDSHIAGIAVVVGQKWTDQILMFIGAGRRQAPVESFPVDGESAARDWLQRQSE